MVLAGGDLSSCERLHISVTANRQTPAHSLCVAAACRATCCQVGRLGLARVGLNMLEAQGRAAIEAWPAACAAHLHPEPQVDAGLMLARAGSNARPPALMDVSDGIMRDLPRLLGLTGELERGRRIWPRHAGSRDSGGPWSAAPGGGALCRPTGKNPVHEALLGGEDYALLGTCAPDRCCR